MASAVALAAVLVLGGGGSPSGPGHQAARHDLRTTTSATPKTSTMPTASVSLQAPVPASTPSASAPGVPVQVTVPRVGISSGLEALGLDSQGRLRAPSRYARAGWYADGVRPGATGPAVIAGHVDSTSGPAVFFDLRRVRIGDTVVVQDDVRHLWRFTVTRIDRYPKSHFPTDTVYGPTAVPVVRLVTCTGAFDRIHRNYLDNLVVSAALDAPRAG